MKYEKTVEGKIQRVIPAVAVRKVDLADDEVTMEIEQLEREIGVCNDNIQRETDQKTEYEADLKELKDLLK